MIGRINALAQYLSQRCNIPIEVIQGSRLDPASFDMGNAVIIELTDNTDCETTYNDHTIRFRNDESETTGNDEFIGEDRIATVSDNRITILFEVTDEKSFNLLNSILGTRIPEISRRWHKERSEKLTTLLASGIEKRITVLRENIAESRLNRENLSHQLFEISRKLNDDRQILKILKIPKLPIHRKAKRDYSDIRKLVPGLYSSIRFEDESILARSNQVDVYYNDFDYDLGIFEIKINIAKGDITINNLTNPVNDFPHPHVDCDGHVCWGNIGSGVYKMLGQNEIYGLLELIHKFLHEYNPESPYQKIDLWNPEYSEEEDAYSRCRDTSYGYTCVQCSDSDCPFYEGAFDECAEDANLEYCTQCQYRCSYGDEMITNCLRENGPLTCMSCGYIECPNYFRQDACHEDNAGDCASCDITRCRFNGEEHGETDTAGIRDNDPCECVEQD